MALDVYSLEPWQQKAFSAGLLLRMVPNYQYFAEAASFGDAAVLNNILDVIWQKLSGLSIKINIEAQTEKLLAVTPEPRDFDFYAVYPASDACSGLLSLLESFFDKQLNPASEVSRLSMSCVQAYIEFCSLEVETRESQAQHPLIQWEKATQAELFDLVKILKEGKSSCQRIKEVAIGDRLSSLAIEY
ncbi:YjaG family protein [Aliikangiella sp. G2MR2-5]|uniref:DUF416 family protein n=1 Tax=Aliikangiella sp. G2MR2-5 TaxID=2788943 RepID=UPI0018AB018E|nr:YjaG family protein [Aliikangiella sp. G2MR2-5]